MSKQKIRHRDTDRPLLASLDMETRQSLLFLGNEKGTVACVQKCPRNQDSGRQVLRPIDPWNRCVTTLSSPVLPSFCFLIVSLSYSCSRESKKGRKEKEKALSFPPFLPISRQRLTDGQGPGIHPSDVFG